MARIARPLTIAAAMAFAAAPLRAADDAPPALTGRVAAFRVGWDDLRDDSGARELVGALRAADAAGPAAIIVEIDSPGGEFGAATFLADAILDLQAPAIAWVHRSAMGAAALPLAACDRIFVAPASRIGMGLGSSSDGENAEKSKRAAGAEANRLSALRATLRAIAKAAGHRPALFEALADPSLDLAIGSETLSAAGAALALDADQAVQIMPDGRPLLAEGLAADMPALLSAAGLEGAAVFAADPRRIRAQIAKIAKESEALAAKKARTGISTSAAGVAGAAADGTPAAKKPRAGDPGAATPPPAAQGRALRMRETSYAGKIVVLSIGEKDLMNAARFEWYGRALKKAGDDGAAAVIFDIDTPGGAAWKTSSVMLRDLPHAKCRTVAFVNPRAISAGALISVSCDAIYMAPTAVIGASAVVTGSGQGMDEATRAKYDSAFSAMARAAAKAKGHNHEVVEAMVDVNSELIVDGVVLKKKGEILTLDAQEATREFRGGPLLARAILPDLEAVIAAEGLQGEVLRPEPLGFEKLAAWTASWAALLIMIGIAGAYAEMKAPGFGVAGAVSLAAFGLFFFGHYAAGSLAGWEAVAAFVLGVALVFVEVFLMPGMVIPGLVGAALILGSLVYVMAGLDWPAADGGDAASPAAWSGAALAEALRRPLLHLGLGVVGGGALILLLMRLLPDTPFLRRLTLREAIAGGPATPDRLGHEPVAAPERLPSVGARGAALGPLRPSGRVQIGGVEMEAHTRGGFIPAESKVRVSAVQGDRVFVEAA